MDKKYLIAGSLIVGGIALDRYSKRKSAGLSDVLLSKKNSEILSVNRKKNEFYNSVNRKKKFNNTKDGVNFVLNKILNIPLLKKLRNNNKIFIHRKVSHYGSIYLRIDNFADLPSHTIGRVSDHNLPSHWQFRKNDKEVIVYFIDLISSEKLENHFIKIEKAKEKMIFYEKNKNAPNRKENLKKYQDIVKSEIKGKKIYFINLDALDFVIDEVNKYLKKYENEFVSKKLTKKQYSMYGFINTDEII